MNEALETSKAMIIPSDASIPSLQPNKQINSNQLEIVFDFSVGTGKILETFASIGQQMGFSLIEQQVNHSTLIKRNKKGLMDMINCFSSDLADSDVTAIKLTIKTNQSNSTRVCKIRGLVGSKVEVRMFMRKFESKAKQLRNYKSLFEQDFVQNSEEQTNPMHIEVIANYSFYKILSMENYGLGKRLAEMLQSYKKYGDVEKTLPLLPQPIQQIHEIVNWVVESLFKQFNSGRKQMEKIMPYCRVSVEKYVCEKLIPIIYPVYKEHTRTKDEQFIIKKVKILDTRTVEQILQDVCLSRKFWLVKQVPDSFKKPLTEQKLLSNRRIIPFYRASEQLERLPHIMSIRQKIKHCELMYTSIKSSVFSFHAGKQQLNNMQDILPVLMLIILISDIPNLACQIEMMNDFMSLQTWEGQSQKRLLINLRESFNYIARDWKV